MRTRARTRTRESGQIVLWTAFLLPILLLAGGLTFDVGNMVNTRDELKNATDGAALAGAQALFDTKASDSYVRTVTAAVAAQNQVPALGRSDHGGTVSLAANTGNAAGGDIVLGAYDFDTSTFTRAASPVDMSLVNAVQ